MSSHESGETVDLAWLDLVDPEIEQRLLPIERAILVALRRYRTIFARNPTAAERTDRGSRV